MSKEIFKAINDAPIVWTTGVGKSAAVADLLSRYLRNVGVPSAFLDATDYWHGGRGGVKENHLLIVVSASGTTEEIVALKNDCVCRMVHVGADSKVNSGDLWWSTPEPRNSRAVSDGPLASARAVYDLVCEYAHFTGVSKREAEVNHPAGVIYGIVR